LGATLALAIKVMLVVFVVVGCMALGWAWSQRSNRTRPTKGQLAQGPRGKKDEKVARKKPADLPPGPGKGDPSEPRAPGEEAPPPRPEPEPVGPTFAKDVLPIFESRCISCHGGRRKRGGLDLRTLDAVREGGDNGSSVKPGSLEGSPLWESIVSDRMPTGKKKLSAAQKKVIREWIASGAR
jgi:hypothetical protein